MASTKQNGGRTPVAPNFKDVDKESVARAQAALAGGKQPPLTPPKGAKVSTDKNGVQYTRWPEHVVVMQAYRSVSSKGLMDVAVIAKVRQSASGKNNGARVFGHFYRNEGADISEGHAIMNDRSNGSIITLLTATGYMPTGGALKGSLLDKMFPAKSQPGASSPLNNKPVVANIVQQLGPMKDPKTGKPVLDDEGEPILEKRDSIESFLPEGEPDQTQSAGNTEE